MKVQIKYADGRLDVFDTDSHTPAQPFGQGCLLADYELHFEDMGKGLWLQAHYYDADPSYREDLEEGAVPVARRSMGWRFLLAEAGELKEVEQVLVDGERALVRMGEALVDVARLDCATALLLTDAGGPSLASKLQGVVDALRASGAAVDDEEAAKLAGADWESLAWARELQPLQDATGNDDDEGWMDYEGDQADI